MSKRRKYEPAGGVVPIAWHRGAPSSGEQFGMVVAEVWDASWHWSEDTLDVRARMRLLSWGTDPSGEAWIDLLNAKPVSASARFRRWFRPSGVTTNVSITLGDWPHAR